MKEEENTEVETSKPSGAACCYAEAIHDGVASSISVGLLGYEYNPERMSFIHGNGYIVHGAESLGSSDSWVYFHSHLGFHNRVKGVKVHDNPISAIIELKESGDWDF